MDAQSLWTAAVAVLAVVLAVVASVRARRRGEARRPDFGTSLRSGAVGELLRGAAFSVPFLALLLVALPLSGLTTTSGPAALGPAAVASAGIAVYFAVLFTLEELVFRGLLMGGLGVLAGRLWALSASSVLVALAYAFAPGTSVLAVVGAVVANALPGWARWRSGRIWWGLGQRWVWNAGIVAAGLRDSGFALQAPPAAPAGRGTGVGERRCLRGGGRCGRHRLPARHDGRSDALGPRRAGPMAAASPRRGLTPISQCGLTASRRADRGPRRQPAHGADPVVPAG